MREPEDGWFDPRTEPLLFPGSLKAKVCLNIKLAHK